MSRRHYLISYDVADDKRRDKIYQALLDSGDHAQYSVFFCQLTLQELAVLKGRLHEFTHETQDQILIVDLGKASYDVGLDVQTIGKDYNAPSRTTIV